MTQDEVPGLATPEFRRLARAVQAGANDAMFRTCEQMTTRQRRAAANTLIGHLHLGSDADAQP